ncbi:hypothetical protein CcaverHIS002_0401940 [Cutaneotrichosporon cavernicola]|nr:hypothetical protein CcaverHIS002_0401940 [Cutaneotrichosporon cavernicola]BEI99143.1 hypothetical protein CcaverHIS631_0401860 [Cutaneotrichosporon cavernicola]BEJ06918.1 hypothetical protein CcaverHIS641_0401870 [Cutaneotrichosporon cavernicola]
MPAAANATSASPARAPKNIAVVGGGIVGVCTAYFLAISPHRPAGSKITLVEGTGVASAASGNAGGFLARDWHGPATASLSAMSFDLHRKLAEQFGGSKHWQYRSVDTLSVTIDGQAEPATSRSPVPWIPKGNIQKHSQLGTHSTTAQCHPRLLTRFLAERFLREEGCALVLGTAKALALDSDGVPHTLMVNLKEDGSERIIDVDTVILTAGPWLGRLAEALLPSSAARGVAVDGQMAHTLLLRTKEPTTPHCLFVDLTLNDGAVSEPEVYPRPDGTVVICGASCAVDLPETAGDIIGDPASVDKLRTQAAGISPVFSEEGGAAFESSTACFLPIPDRGRPVIGKVPGMEGVYVGGGLSCWGITQGPGTGLVLAEMVLEGEAKTADVSKLSP